ncbi:DeoR family transcriptional regulator [Enterococcus florum]|uniref:DeoR family transcriptional regulator n=1 Tax=Enterococcus florum TaxID=2480627 RepID=A0A4P5PFZ6_9ENTE|nr:DeoR/GlpR family DNA-binding transcription regulator [Enterococcus florum]GCF92413.1 DeoR family transcriptional regulator [Enterococcus florum]
MLTEERRAKVLAEIKRHQFISVNQLSRIFNVHGTTIRRDLDELEEQGKVIRIHGGVVPSDVKQEEPTFNERETEKIEEKIRIGQYAATLIKNGECIILDSGTTTLQIARSLNALKNIRNVTVITNDVNIASFLRGNNRITTVVTGGTLFHDSFMLNGQITNETIAKLNVDKGFIATPALDIETGVNHFNELLVSAKRGMVQAASQKIVVADHSKIGHRALYPFLPLNEIDTLITDDKADPLLLKQLKTNGIKRIKTV